MLHRTRAIIFHVSWSNMRNVGWVGMGFLVSNSYGGFKFLLTRLPVTSGVPVCRPNITLSITVRCLYRDRERLLRGSAPRGAEEYLQITCGRSSTNTLPPAVNGSHCGIVLGFQRDNSHSSQTSWMRGYIVKNASCSSCRYMRK